MTNFISQAPAERFTTPAGIYYDLRQHDFVFISSDRPVTSTLASFRFENGKSIESYKYWDSYSDYFGQYVVENSQVYINVVTSEMTYNHVYCMAPDISFNMDDNVQNCEREFKFITEISSTTIYHIKS